MKQLLIILLSLAFLAGGCDTDNKPGSESENQPEASTQNRNVDLSGRMKYVVSGIWWYEGYVSSRDSVKLAQRGKWFEFKPDGTFDFGKFQDKTGTGTWQYDNETETLNLFTPSGEETREWKTMMSKTNDIMVWMGPPRGPNAGDQAKLVKYLQRPTDKDVSQ